MIFRFLSRPYQCQNKGQAVAHTTESNTRRANEWRAILVTNVLFVLGSVVPQGLISVIVSRGIVRGSVAGERRHSGLPCACGRCRGMNHILAS